MSIYEPFSSFYNPGFINTVKFNSLHPFFIGLFLYAIEPVFFLQRDRIFEKCDLTLTDLFNWLYCFTDTIRSTRRLVARPASVSLEEMG